MIFHIVCREQFIHFRQLEVIRIRRERRKRDVPELGRLCRRLTIRILSGGERGLDGLGLEEEMLLYIHPPLVVLRPAEAQVG